MEVSKGGKRMLGYIWRSLSFRIRDILMALYRGLVWPHLEYAVGFFFGFFCLATLNRT